MYIYTKLIHVANFLISNAFSIVYIHSLLFSQFLVLIPYLISYFYVSFTGELVRAVSFPGFLPMGQQ